MVEIKIRSRLTVICAHPYTRKSVGRGEMVDDPVGRTEIRGDVDDEQVREWLRSIGATTADVYVWGSYQRHVPGRFDPHPHRLSERQVKL